MPERLVERGIGESRIVRVQKGEIVEARILLDGIIPAGSVVEGRLRSVGNDGRNAVAALTNGEEVLLPRRPSGTEGALLNVEITRERIPGTEPWKRPIGRATDAAPSIAVSPGQPLPFPPPGRDRLDQAGWADLLEEARSGIVSRPAVTLRVSPTPAMTLIDVDTFQVRLEDSVVVGAEQAARAILRHGIGGSIGIDLPTVRNKSVRAEAAAAIDRVLAGTTFERTAVNGFGFVQIVRPRSHASLFELAADRAAFEGRALLRRAALERTGPTRLVVHSAMAQVLERNPGWLDALARQVGGAVTLRSDPSLPIHGAYAESS